MMLLISLGTGIGVRLESGLNGANDEAAVEIESCCRCGGGGVWHKILLGMEEEDGDEDESGDNVVVELRVGIGICPRLVITREWT